MASNYLSAVARVQKDFSRYFKIETKSNCIWRQIESFNDDDDLLGIQAEMHPLNGSNKNESLNDDCLSTVTNSITNTSFLPQTENTDQIQLSFDCQKEDNLDAEHRSHTVVDRINSTQELINVLEANVVQDQLKTDGTQDLCCLVDYWNKSADVTAGEAEADGTIESLIRALTKCENSNAEFDSIRSNEKISAVVADAGKLISEEPIDLIGEAHEKIKKSTDIVNLTVQCDANGTGQKLLSPIQNTEFPDQQVRGNMQQVFNNGQQGDGNGQHDRSNEQQVGDHERQASSINDELNQYITFYEEKRNEADTTDFALGLNAIIDVSKPRASSKAVDGITQQNYVSHPPVSIDSPLVFENNITSNQFKIMYEVVPDPNDPTMYVLRPSTSDNLTNLVSANSPQTVSFGKSLDALMRVVKPCSVLLKDCLLKHPRKSSFGNFDLWTQTLTQTSNRALPQKLAGIKSSKKNIQHKAAVIKPKKTKAAKKSRKDNLIEKKHENVIAPSPKLPPEIPKMITNLTRPALETTVLPMVNQPSTMERKNVLINDWIQESSQVTPDKYMDVNELLQDANLFISSDIEDDAFQLAKYMESNDQTKNDYQTTNSINPASSNIPQQQLYERKSVNYSRPPWNAALKSGNSFEEPLDLSKKKTTSTPTDTGFGNDSYQVDVRSSHRSLNVVSQDHSKVVVDVSNTNNTEHGGIINNFTSNICTEVSKAGLNKNHNFAENDLKKREPQTKNFPSTCEPKPATATDTGRKRKSSSVKTTLPKKKKQLISEEKPAFRSKEGTSKEKIRFHQRPSSTDLTKESDAFSTDYEPSDDEGYEIVNGDQKETFVTGTFPNNNSKKWETLVIKIPNNIASSSRVVVVGESSSLHSGIMVPDSSNGTFIRQMMYVFNRPCLKHLNGKDCGVVCTFNHDLPPARDIFEKSMLFSNGTILCMYYNFIAKSNIAFTLYFEMICEIFGLRKMEPSLINAIRDCEKREKISFFKCIYRGLVMAGLSKGDALTKIAERSCKTKSSYDVILEIMIEDDALYFIKMLKQYYWHGTINSTHMLKLLQQVLDNPVPSLIRVFVDILDKYWNSDVCDVGTFELLIRKAAFLANGDLNLKRRWNIFESRIKRLKHLQT